METKPMSLLKESLTGLQRSESKHIESLDIDVQVAKLTVKQAKEFQAWQKKNKIKEGDLSGGVKTLSYVLSQFFFDDEGEPLVEPDNEDLIGELPVEAITECTEAFQEVNGLGDLTPEELEEAVKKK